MFRELRNRIKSEKFRRSFGYGLTLGDYVSGTDDLGYDIGRCVPVTVAFSLACALTYALLYYGHP